MPLITLPRKNRRKRERRAFPHYMQFMNDRTGELVGDLADISPKGFRLECSKPIPPNTEYPFRIEVPPDISDRGSIVFTARSLWCKPDPVDASLYDAGFEITGMDPADSDAFELIFERYGSTSTGKDSKPDYLWQD